jgi:hypothetical protein
MPMTSSFFNGIGGGWFVVTPNKKKRGLWK